MFALTQTNSPRAVTPYHPLMLGPSTAFLTTAGTHLWSSASGNITFRGFVQHLPDFHLLFPSAFPYA